MWQNFSSKVGYNSKFNQRLLWFYLDGTSDDLNSGKQVDYDWFSLRNSELVYFKEFGVRNWCILRNSELVCFTEFENL